MMRKNSSRDVVLVPSYNILYKNTFDLNDYQKTLRTVRHAKQEGDDGCGIEKELDELIKGGNLRPQQRDQLRQIRDVVELGDQPCDCPDALVPEPLEVYEDGLSPKQGHRAVARLPHLLNDHEPVRSTCICIKVLSAHSIRSAPLPIIDEKMMVSFRCHNGAIHLHFRNLLPASSDLAAACREHDANLSLLSQGSYVRR